MGVHPPVPPQGTATGNKGMQSTSKLSAGSGGISHHPSFSITVLWDLK